MIPHRYVFHGNASPFGGFLFRPQHSVFDVHGASSLTVSGGRSSAKTGKQSFPFASFESARTFAQGTFREHGECSEKQRESHEWNPPDESMHPVTEVFANVTELRVGGDSLRVDIGSVSAHLVSHATPARGESAVRVEKDTDISDVVIGGHRLKVELDLNIFQEYTTRASLLAALEKDEFIAKHRDSLFMTAAVEGEHPPARPRLANRCTIYATIVKRLVWEGDPLDGARIHDNVVDVPEFGRIFFGEVLIDEGEKRLTMVRFKLGSPDGGVIATAEVQDNGQWSP